MEVLQGGVGAGTQTRFTVHVMGTAREVRHVIAEPEPGRILVESNLDGTGKTQFTVDPAQSGNATRLTIATELAARGGVLGTLERWMTSAVLRRIYRKEMARIADYAARAA